MNKRIFVAIDLPQSTREFLTDLDPHIHGVRWVDIEQMHLTLGFFGDVAEDVDLTFRENLRAIEFGAFFLPIIGAGAFPTKNWPKVLWIGVSGGHPHLFQLHKRVSDAAIAAGLEPDLRPWHPHVTLARCRDVTPQSVRNFLKSNANVDAGMIRVDSFYLYSSKLTPAGPMHTCELSVRSRD